MFLFLVTCARPGHQPHPQASSRWFCRSSRRTFRAIHVSPVTFNPAHEPRLHQHQPAASPVSSAHRYSHIKLNCKYT
ncbi:hypothetical protein E2C01_009634 [Portunus trituberculatus]|uniref:Uncharacterized protein n=1 Tax=Portunus trituberculatus TaxID=210409 RepID=A0A5B7D6H8_PORTR|nr:hypothetical protein [Portunus trituberculatus]